MNGWQAPRRPKDERIDRRMGCLVVVLGSVAFWLGFYCLWSLVQMQYLDTPLRPAVVSSGTANVPG